MDRLFNFGVEFQGRQLQQANRLLQLRSEREMLGKPEL